MELNFLETIQWFLNFELFKISGHPLLVSNIITFFIIIVVAKFIDKFIFQIFHNKFGTDDERKGRRFALYQLLKYLIYVFAIIFGLQSLGINISIFLAGSAALMVGLGLGLQSFFIDFVSGIILLFEGTLSVGDIVQVDQSLVGEIKAIGLRVSRIETVERKRVIVPNSKLINDRIINWSDARNSARFGVKVGVAYGSDVELVKKLLLKSVENHPAISKNMAPVVRFADFGESSLDFEILFWTKRFLRIDMVKSDIRFKINKLFRENHVEIPFPQRDLHIKSNNSVPVATGKEDNNYSKN